MEKTRIERAIEYITKLFKGNGDGHDLAHSLRVYKNAMMIAKAEGQGDDRGKNCTGCRPTGSDRCCRYCPLLSVWRKPRKELGEFHRAFL